MGEIAFRAVRRGAKLPGRLRHFLEWQLKKSHESIADLIYGVDTFRWAPDPLRNTSTRYVYDAAPWSAVRRTLRNIELDFPQFTFIDMGCGKGRMVLAASGYEFASVIGVEFSPSLCRIAERNLATCRLLRRHSRGVRIIECDATDFTVPGTPCIFFFYNPFSFDLFDVVIRNITSSYRENPRLLYLILVGMSTMFPRISVIPGLKLLHSFSIPVGMWTNRSVYIFLVTDG
jgi:hypothetical protein